MSSNLLTVLRALSKPQRRALVKFVRSPYHVTHAGVSRMLDYLLEHLHLPEISREELLGKLPEWGEDPDPRRLYHLTNYTMETVEQFLAQETRQNARHLQHADTIEALRQLRLEDPANQMLKYARKRLEQDTHRGLAFYQADVRLHWEAYHLSLQQGRVKTSNAQALSEAQDIAFICDKLRTGCMMLSQQVVSQQHFDKGLLQPVLQFLDGHHYLTLPMVAAYYHGYYAQLGAPGSDIHFSRLKDILQHHAPQFSLSETHDLYLMAINFCIRQINQQNERFYAEIFDLYRSGLTHGALLENGVLSRFTYNNITRTGLRLQEYTWVKQFLHDYAPLLPETHREGAVHFNLARYFFETGAYKDAMQHLLHIEYDDVLHNLAAKAILCKIYFNIGEYDALENQLDSMQVYLRRKKVLGYHRDTYLTTIKLFRKLATLNPNNAKEKEKLREEIESTPALTEREWLLKALGST
ncbi:MAG TPA: hypothetical protein VK168_02045 [Saprospiraceae bacterium]|nr:hypothetical protein [Saprospiraceae bacterium]